MNIKFSKPLAYSKDYPTPKVKGFTDLKFTKLLFKKRNCVFDSGFFTINGRTGLAIIGKYLKLKATDTILLPSYHCPALVEPFIWLGVNIRFYKLNKDLSIDIKDFNNKIDDTVKVCLFVHFFGFPPDLSKLTVLEKNNIIIIEDCAHSFYDAAINNPKKIGHYFFVSCNKFFPCTDGSIIYGINDKNIRKNLISPSLLNDFKRFLNFIPLLSQAIEFIKKIIPSSKHADSSVNKDVALFRYFNPDEINKGCSQVSKFIVEYSNHKDIKEKRRHNFEFLLRKLIDSNAGIPLFTELPDNVTPYVFPFVLNKVQYFDDIRNSGLSLFRWEELADSDCATSQYYYKNLVQIPCHQDLTQTDLDSIVAIIKKLTV